MEPQNKLWLKPLLIAAGLAAIAVCTTLLVTGVVASRDTGLVRIKTSDSQALISVTQENHTAAVIGTGNANVRLNPGTYRITAVSGAKQASSAVTIGAKETTSLSLKLTDKPKVPSAASIDFQNTDSLIDAGLTVQQVSAIKNDLFNFSPSARVITINPQSVSPGPLDHSNPNPTFTLRFNVSVDSKDYGALATYTDLVSIQLQLYNSSGAQVFDSSTTPAPTRPSTTLPVGE